MLPSQTQVCEHRGPHKWDGAAELQDQQWIKVKARLDVEYWFEYEGDGPVLYAESIEPAEAPEKIMVEVR